MAEARGLVIAAPASGSGKTLATLGLLRALARAGRQVASAKAGPDYIDPRFHEAASGRPCFNLDGWAMPPERIRALAALTGAHAELVVVEGVMGLFDGAGPGVGSTADLAEALDLPVVLVVDAKAQAQSVAPLVKGFAEYREGCDVAGVVFNRVGSAKHAAILHEAVAPLGIAVLGAVPNDSSIEMPSRHLGLVQAGEHQALDALLDRAADLIGGALDLDAVAALARPLPAHDGAAETLAPIGQRIAVARDEAFGFAYPHLLADWHAGGAEIHPFSPLAGEGPDAAADAVFLPGGYPELHGPRLAANNGFLDGLRAAAARGALVYGECGGFMVLGDYLIDAEGARHQMAGLLPVGTSFAERGLHLGYRRLRQDGALPWPRALRGHEFHYSRLDWQGEGEALFEAEDWQGQSVGAIGLRRGRVMGSYAHIIDREAA